MSEFIVHQQLEDDCFIIGDWSLCRLLLMNDARFPWCILVPRRAGIREIYELTQADQCVLIQESSRLAHALMATFHGEKLNVAALGNKVPQLHLHHIVRFRQDSAWPNPVWGQGQPESYTESKRISMIMRLRGVLGMDK